MKLIKKMISITLALSTVSAVPIVNAQTEIPVDIDKIIYDQLLSQNYYDTNEDGILSELEFSNMDSMSFSLDNVVSLKGIEKAKKLQNLDMSGGNIDDFSILSQLPNINYLSISNMPLKDLSSLKNIDLNFLYVTETQVTEEEKLNFIQYPDIETEEGYLESFSLKPHGLLNFQFEIKDDSIAGLGIEGNKISDELYYNKIIAKSQGYTTYDIKYNDKVVATRNITVNKLDNLYDPALDTGVKIREISDYNAYEVFSAFTMDQKVYWYEKSKFMLKYENVKAIESIYDGGNSNIYYVLYNDGKMMVDEKPIFDENTYIKDMWYKYVATEKGELMYVDSNKGEVVTVNICSDFDRFLTSNLFYKKDGTLSEVKISKNNSEYKVTLYDYGKINVISKDDYNRYFLDDENRLWFLSNSETYSSTVEIRGNKLKFIDNDVVELGYTFDNSPFLSFGGNVAYKKTDGQIYMVKGGVFEENENQVYTTSNNSPLKKYYESFYFVSNTDNENIKIFNDDRQYGFFYIDDKKTGYFTCLGNHMALTNVKKAYGAVSNGNDYSIFIIRTDDTLWEYKILAQTVNQVDFDIEKELLQGDLDDSGTINTVDIYIIIKFLLNDYTFSSEQIKKADFNKDNTVDLIDLIMMKKYILN